MKIATVCIWMSRATMSIVKLKISHIDFSVCLDLGFKTQTISSSIALLRS